MSLLDSVIGSTGLPAGDIRAMTLPGERYRYKEIPRKRPGAARHISMPTKAFRAVLKAVEAWLAPRVNFHKLIHPAAHGFVAGCSIITNARVHLDPSVLVTMDLEDWFGHVNEKKLRAALAGTVVGPDLNLLIGLCLDQDRLPQGAPTSPLLANVAAGWMDRKLQAICNRWCWRYSRYADDLAFSTTIDTQSFDVRCRFVREVTGAIHSCGWRLAKGKTRIRHKHQRQEVTGLIVNGTRLRVPREYKRMVRAAINNRRHKRSRVWSDRQTQSAISFVKMVEPEEGQKLDIEFAHVRLMPISVEEAQGGRRV